MNKVNFNEGGNPVYLDDLELIQSNSFAIPSCVLKALTGGDGPYLLSAPYVTPIGGSSIEVRIGGIIHQGSVILIPATTLNIGAAAIGTAKIGIREGYSDLRECADGQEKYCRKTQEAFVYVGESDADVSYNLCDLECLNELISRKSGQERPDTRWKTLPVEFYNGYSGSIRYTTGGITQLKIDIKSSQTVWDEGQKGIIFAIPNYSLVSELHGKHEAVSYIPLGPNGEHFEYSWNASNTMFGTRISSGIDISNPYVRIYGHEPTSVETVYNPPATEYITHYTDTYGLLPPCKEGDAYGSINITIK